MWKRFGFSVSGNEKEKTISGQWRTITNTHLRHFFLVTLKSRLYFSSVYLSFLHIHIYIYVQYIAINIVPWACYWGIIRPWDFDIITSHKAQDQFVKVKKKTKKHTHATGYIINLCLTEPWCCSSQNSLNSTSGISSDSTISHNTVRTGLLINCNGTCPPHPHPSHPTLLLIFSTPWGRLTHFHELAPTRHVAIRAATADLDGSERSELASGEVLKLLPGWVLNFSIFHSCASVDSYCVCVFFFSSAAALFVLIEVDFNMVI